MSRAVPDYSVIIATYNYGRFLPQAIDSALDQTVPAREIIVVDDGSSDNTPEVLARYDGRLRVIRQPNGGQAAAWNAAFEMAEGEWIAFLDADDWWLPERVEQCLRSVPIDIGVIMHDLAVTGTHGDHASWVKWTAVRIREGDFGKESVRNGLPWSFSPTSGVLARRKMLASIFPLTPQRWRTCADAPLLHRASLRTQFRFMDEPLGSYRVHGGNSYHQRGWYDGDDEPGIILENLWLLQRLAYEINADLEGSGSRMRVALWNNEYYARMIGWVAGRHGWRHTAATTWRRRGQDQSGRHPLYSFLSRTRELHEYQRRRDRAIGATLRRLAASAFPDLDLAGIWNPDITRHSS